MSAKKYKDLLHLTEQRIAQYQQAAEDWRTVADDRLKTMIALGKVSGLVLHHLRRSEGALEVELGESTDDSVWNDPDSPDLIIEGVVQNLDVLSRYSVSLSLSVEYLTSELDKTEAKIKDLTPPHPVTKVGSPEGPLLKTRELGEHILSLVKQRGQSGQATYLTGPNTVANIATERRALVPVRKARGSDFV